MKPVLDFFLFFIAEPFLVFLTTPDLFVITLAFIFCLGSVIYFIKAFIKGLAAWRPPGFGDIVTVIVFFASLAIIFLQLH